MMETNDLLDILVHGAPVHDALAPSFVAGIINRFPAVRLDRFLELPRRRKGRDNGPYMKQEPRR